MSLMTRIGDFDRSAGDPKVITSGPSSLTGADKLARALGWLSLGLGLVEIIGARRIARALNLDDQAALIRALGAREIASGFMTLAPGHTAGVSARIAGDVLDAGLLLAAKRSREADHKGLDRALGAVLVIAALDVACAALLSAQHGRSGRPRDYSDRSGFPNGPPRPAMASARPAPEARTLN